jgi:hypothetical protein
MTDDLTDITDHLDVEARAVVERGIVTRGQRLVIRELLLEAKEKIQNLRDDLAELEDLRRWKREATEVLGNWEVTWDLAGRPGPLGLPKSECVTRHIERLRAECDAWMNGVADAVEPLGYDRGAACGPADLLPGLSTLLEKAQVAMLHPRQRHRFIPQQGSNICVCGEWFDADVHQVNAEPPPELPQLTDSVPAEMLAFHEFNGRELL